MASPAHNPELSARDLAELSALADGSLDPARVGEVQDRIAASAPLSALFERERRVVSALRAANAAERAPQRLRVSIETSRPGRWSHASRRARYGGALAGALAAVALALVLLLPAGTPGGPSLSQAAGLALRGAAAPPPAPDSNAPPGSLDRKIEDVYFPNWSRGFGWRAVGQRTDRLEGRQAVTVFYQWKGKRIAYTIVAAPALTQPAANVTRLEGTELRTLALNGRLVVTWRRAGHTCVLSGSGVPAAALRYLAAWQSPGGNS